MRFYALIWLMILLPQSVFSQASNAGIVRGLWYDQELFFEGDQVRIYVAVRNNTGADLSGAVEFYVNGERIERNFIDALDGRIIESWADWIPEYGTSSISATLTRTEISSTASGTRAVELVSALAEDQIFVDRDTDGDTIGNETDTDDDGDGRTDEEEITAGTDPLSFDEPENTNENENNTDPNEAEAVETAAPAAVSAAATDPAGLEQYLTENPVSSAFTSVTELVNTTKKRLDAYRDSRDTSSEHDPVTPQTEGSATNETSETEVISSTTSNSETTVEDNNTTTATQTASTSHIGEITRTSTTSTNTLAVLVSNIWGALITFSLFLYDKILWLLSSLLGRPVLIQVLLLVLMLFLLLKLARRLSHREST